MKSLLLTVCMFTLSISSFANKNDNIFIIYIENDTTNTRLNRRINVVFENISNDTIVLFSKYNNNIDCYSNKMSGCHFSFYYNKKLVEPTWGELPKFYYRYGNGQVKIAPKQIIKIKMDLPYFGSKEQAKNDEFGIELALGYRYYNPKDRIIKFEYFESEYLILSY